MGTGIGEKLGDDIDIWGTDIDDQIGHLRRTSAAAKVYFSNDWVGLFATTEFRIQLYKVYTRLLHRVAGKPKLPERNNKEEEMYVQPHDNDQIYEDTIP